MRGGGEVGFIEDGDITLIAGGEHGLVGGCEGGGGIEDEENAVGVAQGVAGAGYADFFDGVGGFADAGGVGELVAHAADFEALGEHVAGGAGDVGDDGAVGGEQGVHQAGLAHVGAAAEHDGRAVADDARAPAVGGTGELVPDAGSALAHVFCGHVLVDFVREVGGGFDFCEETRQLLAHAADGRGHAAAKLTDRRAAGGLRARADETHDRLGLA